ncbi:unnamed protein product [Rotaria sp. Silwood1]|nr:unnamed protein product [Rotaria sp. Silwood1]CAF3789857.1 unnamed protein product [Rotaria sp. Silwood1]CAF4817549.1 unnamed protein product [Rotaria sp. Silwood1]
MSSSKILQKNFLRQISAEIERKIDRLEQQTQIVGGILQWPKFTRFSSSDRNEKINQDKDNIIETSPPHTIIETGITHHEMKGGSQRLRWNLLFNLLVWLVVPFPFWIPFISNKVALYMLPSIQGVFVFMWTIIAILAVKNVFILRMNHSRKYKENIDTLEKTRIRHIVAVSCYKEPIELIATTVQSVADQTEVNRIIMVISFEEKTPEKKKKRQYLQDRFKDAGFEQIIFTVHPYGLPNEIPGKCSNSNYGLRMAVNKINVADDDMKNILVTTCDADSKFPPNYIAALTWKYLQENQPALTTIYQSPLFYNWKLDSLSFITRVTGLLRSLLMLGALIPFNINTMSIFSYSLSLAKQGNFIHPSYQMDDIICLIRWMGVTKRRIRISMIPVAVISGPTSGETVEFEIIEWARQARRWTIGAAEVFHYFIIKAKHIPKMAAFSWGFAFIIYYGVLLCTAGLFGLTSTLSMILLVKRVPLSITYVITTGDVLDESQQESFKSFYRSGKGFVGIHAAADTEYAWSWYNGLLGGYFAGHPSRLQNATLNIVDQNFIATKHLPKQWKRFDEWYNFQMTQWNKVNVLITIDEKSYYGGEHGKIHPMSWYQNYDGGRSFYTQLSHQQDSYLDSLFVQHLLGGIQYAMTGRTK